MSPPSMELINLQNEVFRLIQEMFENDEYSDEHFVGEMTEEHYEDAIDDIVDEEVDEDYKEELMEMVSYDDYINWLNK